MKAMLGLVFLFAVAVLLLAMLKSAVASKIHPGIFGTGLRSCETQRLHNRTVSIGVDTMT
ncbi:hypothetical protein [Cupriavidus nantongensis]|uniref:hypothetical protein n=1 Tax=Cupriavidus nantongensis TaxID=1796606 RepID=UPI001237513C|nr:hypothetical protein [Cupriavidus nantongensis]